ncbi:hypothetical protein ACIBI4_00565 [Streptomyces sp. NPDC050418]|uniref:hypothetical protein n=1 Tax=Streptomyces sp. NPDC050418 TaxID=3365612 RepID=UPI00378F88CF
MAVFLNVFAVALYVWALVLVVTFRDPQAWWWRTQARRFKDPEHAEPSAYEYERIRARGWFSAFVSVAAGVAVMIIVAAAS